MRGVCRKRTRKLFRCSLKITPRLMIIFFVEGLYILLEDIPSLVGYNPRKYIFNF